MISLDLVEPFPVHDALKYVRDMRENALRRIPLGKRRCLLLVQDGIGKLIPRDGVQSARNTTRPGIESTQS